MKLAVGIVDEYSVFVKALANVINSFKEFEVTLTASTGTELLEKLESENKIPVIVLISINPRQTEAAETVEKLTEKYPRIRTAALFMEDYGLPIARMIRAGCYSYLLKSIPPVKLRTALKRINKEGHYLEDIIASNHSLPFPSLIQPPPLSKNEEVLVKFLTTGVTWTEIKNIFKK